MLSPTLEFLISEDPEARRLRGRVRLLASAWGDACAGGSYRRQTAQALVGILEEASARIRADAA